MDYHQNFLSDQTHDTHFNAVDFCNQGTAAGKECAVFAGDVSHQGGEVCIQNTLGQYFLTIVELMVAWCECIVTHGVHNLDGGQTAEQAVNVQDRKSTRLNSS